MAVTGIVQQVRAELSDLGASSELVLTGASSIPGTLTRGDTDLHLRIPPTAMVATIARLSRAWTPAHRSMWTDGFATFERTMAERSVGLALTAIGDAHDERFRAAWSYLRRDRVARADYEAMKAAHDGGDEGAYLEAKGRFFQALEAAARDRASGTSPAPAGTPLPDGLPPQALDALGVLGIERVEDADRWPPHALARMEGVDADALALLAAATAQLDRSRDRPSASGGG